MFEFKEIVSDTRYRIEPSSVCRVEVNGLGRSPSLPCERIRHGDFQDSCHIYIFQPHNSIIIYYTWYSTGTAAGPLSLSVPRGPGHDQSMPLAIASMPPGWPLWRGQHRSRVWNEASSLIGTNLWAVLTSPGQAPPSFSSWPLSQLQNLLTGPQFYGQVYTTV